MDDNNRDLNAFYDGMKPFRYSSNSSNNIRRSSFRKSSEFKNRSRSAKNRPIKNRRIRPRSQHIILRADNENDSDIENRKPNQTDWIKKKTKDAWRVTDIWYGSDEESTDLSQEAQKQKNVNAKETKKSFADELFASNIAGKSKANAIVIEDDETDNVENGIVISPIDEERTVENGIVIAPIEEEQTVANHPIEEEQTVANPPIEDEQRNFAIPDHENEEANVIIGVEGSVNENNLKEENDDFVDNKQENDIVDIDIDEEEKKADDVDHNDPTHNIHGGLEDRSIWNSTNRHPNYFNLILQALREKRVNFNLIRNQHKILPHTKKSRFFCPFCTKKLTRKVTWEQHINLHIGYRPFKCNLCNWRSCNYPNLIKHMKTHENDDESSQ